MTSDNTNLRPYEIQSSGADMTLELLSMKLDAGDIVIPDFQRKYVWTLPEASRLIESFMLGLPVPQIFLYNRKEDQKLLVVDGMQRLSTIHSFFRNDFKGSEFRLKGLNSRWDGMTVHDFSEADLRKLKNIALRATFFEQVRPDDNTSIVEVFERLNTGGLKLNAQEVRHGVIGGRMAELITDCNTIPEWRGLYGKKNPDERMTDEEVVLRILALADSWQVYKRPMNVFLTNFMKEKREISNIEYQSYKKFFSQAVYLAHTADNDLLKDKKRFIVTLADAIIPALIIQISRHKNIEPDSISGKLTSLKNALVSNMEASNEKTTDTDAVVKRISLAVDALNR